MGLLNFGPGNFSDALAGLSQGLLAYGSGNPQGLLTVPAVVAQRRQDRLQNTRQQQLLDMEQQKFGLEKTKLEQEQAQYAQHQAAMDAFKKAHPEYAPYIDAFGGDAASSILKKDFADPWTPKHETRPNGRTNEYGYYDQSGKWITETTSPMDAPRQAPGPTDLERRAIDAGLTPGTPEYKGFMLNGGQQQDGGVFSGNGMDAQSYNIVLSGNPNSPEYAAAYNQLSQPKTQMNPDGTVTQFTPDMGWARKPTYRLPVQPRGGAPMGQSSPMAAPSAAPMSAPQSANPGVTSTPASGGTVTTIQGNLATPQERIKLRDAEAEARTLVGALNDFRNTVKNADNADFLSAYAGGPTKGGADLNASWTNAALLAKGEQLFQLGILNGPDLGIIRQTITDPSTFKGQIANKESYGAGVDKVISLIELRINEKRKSLGLPEIQLDTDGTDYYSKYGLTPKGTNP